MNEKSPRYQQTWPAESAIALWLTPIAVLLLWSAGSAEVPLLIRLAMGIIAALALLLAGAALIKTAVTASSTGDLEIRKTLVGLPVTRIHLDAAGIIRVELESSRAVKAATPRFRIDIVHAKGKFFVVASTKGGTLKDQAAGLADALHCPLQKVGG